jgi:hypothetical protein
MISGVLHNALNPGLNSALLEVLPCLNPGFNSLLAGFRGPFLIDSLKLRWFYHIEIGKIAKP